MVGTHTHVPTCDHRMLPKGTAYCTDLGMTGPYDSVIGVEAETIVERFLTAMPGRFETAKGDPRFAAVVVDVDPETGRASGIDRMLIAEAGRGEALAPELDRLLLRDLQVQSRPPAIDHRVDHPLRYRSG